MAKLLCSLFLAGFVFQANAFSIATDPPNPPLDPWIPSIFNSLDWIASFFKPSNWVINIPITFNHKTLIGWIPNPFGWIPNPFGWIHNPFGWIPNPFGWIPNPFGWIPNPFGWIPGIGYDRCTLQADVGPCKVSETRYYYDQNANACMEFTYGGCKGNRNNFKQKYECEKACRGH